jgi:hypothetical protein
VRDEDRKVKREQQPHKRSFIRELGLTPIAISLGIVILLVIVVGIWFWGVLVEYIGPKDNTDRKDVVQTFALIVAGGVAAIGAIVGIANFWQQRGLARESAQEDLLQAYFERMGDLLTEQNLVDPDREELRQLAKAQTLAVLPRLDRRRKGALLRFLSEAELIQPLPVSKRPSKGRLSKEGEPIVRLRGADLRGAELHNAVLYRAVFRGATLTGADLTGADLPEANLVADLTGADLTGADLRGAVLYQEVGKQTIRAEVTAKQLEAAKCLNGATMPNGQKYEEWLKSRGEENSGTS